MFAPVGYFLSGIPLGNIMDHYCVGLSFVVLFCIVLCCIVLYCMVLCCIVLHCIVLYCVVLYCMFIVLSGMDKCLKVVNIRIRESQIYIKKN